MYRETLTTTSKAATQTSVFSGFGTGSAIWMIVALVLAIIGGILVYFLFVKNKQEFKGFWGKLRKFLAFDNLVIEPILKIFYYIVSIFITLFSFSFISNSFLVFLLTLVIGNIVVRIIYELILMGVLLYRNVVEINSKLKK